MRARSIPEEHEARVIEWFVNGDSYRAIAHRLGEKHEVTTSPGSVSRLVERLGEGDCTDAAARAVIKLRLRAPKLVDDLDHQVAMGNAIAGIDDEAEIPEGVTKGDIEFANRLTLRRLKVAGCLGADADRAMERLRRRADERCREEEEQEKPETPPRPFAEPPSEPVRASSNDRFSVPAEVEPAVTSSGGGPPCPPKKSVGTERLNTSGNPTGDHPASAALLHGGPPPPAVAKRQGDSSAARPIPKPPPEPARASSNDRYTSPPRQGRNEPCACGSGVKFKKCCGSPTVPAHVLAMLKARANPTPA